MGALGAARNTPVLDGGGAPRTVAVKMKGTTTIYEGSLVFLNASGYAIPAATGVTTSIQVGCATQTVVNSGSDGDAWITVAMGAFVWDVHGSAITLANVGTIVYGYDDHTVTLSATTASPAGVVWQVDDAGAWIMTQLPTNSLPVDLTGLENNLASTSNGEGASLVGIEDAGSYYSGATVEDALIQAATATKSVISCPVPAYSAIADAGVLLRLTPGYAGRILGMHLQATTAVTTGSKLTTLTPKIAGGAVTGGVISVTSAGQNAIGAVQNGTAVTAANTFSAAQEITVVASSTTTFVEGAGVIYLVLG